MGGRPACFARNEILARKALNLDAERDPIRTVRSAGYALDDAFVN